MTPRQKVVLAFAVKGWGVRDISEATGMSIYAVFGHLRALRKKGHEFKVGPRRKATRMTTRKRVDEKDYWLRCGEADWPEYGGNDVTVAPERTRLVQTLAGIRVENVIHA